MPNLMPSMDPAIAASKQMLMDDLGNTAMNKLMFPAENEAKGPKIPWLADIADPAVEYVKKPLNQTGVAGALMPAFIPEMASNLAWGRPLTDPISKTREEQEFRESPIGSTIDNIGRSLETLPVAGKMAGLTLAGVAGLIPLMNKTAKMRHIPRTEEIEKIAPRIFKEQASLMPLMGPDDVEYIPKMLQKQAL